MSATCTYQQIKEQYDTTKPIRGRSDDVRPAGKRRRDWERVVKTEHGYAYQMHGTNCVEFTEEKLILRSGGWTTVGTGKFINDYAPVACGKRYNALWVGIDKTWAWANPPTHDHPTEQWLWIPIPAKGEITFTWDETRQRYVIYGRRDDLRPHDILKAHTDEQMLTAFYALLRATQATWQDWQRGVYAYGIASVQRTLYKMHDAGSPEIYDHEWVDPSSKMPTNHVGYT